MHLRCVKSLKREVTLKNQTFSFFFQSIFLNFVYIPVFYLPDFCRYLFYLHNIAEYPTLRVCGGYRHRFLPLLRFLPPGLLFPRCVIPPFCLFRRVIVIIKGFLPVRLPVCVYLCHQLIPVPLCRRWHFLSDLLVDVCVGLDVCPVYKHCSRRQRSGCPSLIQDPSEDRFYRFLCEPMPEIIAHCGEVRQFFIESIS